MTCQIPVNYGHLQGISIRVLARRLAALSQLSASAISTIPLHTLVPAEDCRMLRDYILLSQKETMLRSAIARTMFTSEEFGPQVR